MSDPLGNSPRRSSNPYWVDRNYSSGDFRPRERVSLERVYGNARNSGRHTRSDSETKYRTFVVIASGLCFSSGIGAIIAQVVGK